MRRGEFDEEIEDVVVGEELGGEFADVPSIYPGIPSSSQQEQKRSLLEQIKPEEVVLLLKRMLSGYEYDEIHERWVKNTKYQEFSLSELGVWHISNEVLSAVNKNGSLTTLSDSEIRQISYNTTEIIISQCLANWREYGIIQDTQIEYVARIVYNLLFIALKQAQNGRLTRFIQSVTHEQKTIIEQQSQKRGLFGRGK